MTKQEHQNTRTSAKHGGRQGGAGLMVSGMGPRLNEKISFNHVSHTAQLAYVLVVYDFNPFLAI